MSDEFEIEDLETEELEVEEEENSDEEIEFTENKGFVPSCWFNY